MLFGIMESEKVLTTILQGVAPTKFHESNEFRFIYKSDKICENMVKITYRKALEIYSIDKIPNLEVGDFVCALRRNNFKILEVKFKKD